MRLATRYVKLENFGCHRSLEFTPSPHMNLIEGPNGSGKSTILDAIQILLLGSAAMNGKKDDHISRTAGPNDRSRLVGRFDLGAHQIEIIRGLNKARTELRVDGGEPILDERKVGQALSELLGPVAPLLGEYIFVRQEAITGILDATDTERAKVFAQLFRTRDAEEIWSLVGRRMAVIEIPQRSGELDRLRIRIEDDGIGLAALITEQKSYDDLREYVREADPNYRLVQARHAWLQARQDEQNGRAELYRLAERITAERTTLKQGEEALAALEATRPGALTRADEAKTVLALWKTFERAAKARAALDGRRDALAAEQNLHPKPEAPPEYAPTDEAARKHLAECRADAEWHRRFTTAMAGGKSACPTCGTPAEHLTTALAESQAELVFLDAEIARLDGRFRAAETYEQRLKVWKTWRAGFRERLDQLQADLDRLAEEPAAPAEDRTALEGEVNQLAALEAALATARQTAARLSSGVNHLTGQWEATVVRCEQAAARRRENLVPRARHARAQQGLAAVDARLQERARLGGEIRVRKGRLDDDRAMLKRLEAEEVAMARTRALVDHLTALRGVFHRDALPRYVARNYLGLLQRDVNAVLEEFQTGFTITTTEELAFKADFKNGARDIPAARLSGGQKVLLCLAFRVAVNRHFTHDIGMLALDEPTIWLDEKNIHCVEIALQKLRDLSTTRGLQCLLVSHEPGLSHLFDHVVSLN